jgi:hypothetical protein
MKNDKAEQMNEINQKNQQETAKESKINDSAGFHIEGHIKIFDPETKEVFVDKRNAIHYENMSVALAASLANQGYGIIEGMSFGNGGSTVDPNGIITYLTPNNVGVNSGLYNQTFYKVIDPKSASNIDPTRNFTEIRHVRGTVYTDIFCSVLLDYGEPSGQQAYDNAQNMNSDFVFDEIGLRASSQDSVLGNGRLLTHVIFHPTQKSLNRLIQIDYTVRIQTLTNFSET